MATLISNAHARRCRSAWDTAALRLVRATVEAVRYQRQHMALAVFLPELAGRSAAVLLDDLAYRTGPGLHAAFDDLHARWRLEWRTQGRPRVPIGLGVGVSFGTATVGLLGAAGKKQIAVVGEPVNVAAYLCSQAPAGAVLIDCGSFARAGREAPRATVVRLWSKKPHQRIETICLPYGRPSLRRA